ncbi:MAG: carbamoyltransferase HypF [Anaerolineales bacterium]
MMSPEIVGCKIRVYGIVQGVGFRPFIFSLAQRYQLTGWVRNTSSGVEIEVNGSEKNISLFLQAIRNEAPPLSRIDKLESEPCAPNGYRQFEIVASQPEVGQFIPVSPDMSICSDCQHELFDPYNRRFRYPFINCTNCGPRFSIVRDIPYDRPLTTMSSFQMCAQCQKEYENPLDRRFHAQPIACPECGPKIWFQVNGKRRAEAEDALQLARQWLQQGKILAIKGLGGYHLACDATNSAAVTELRRRKRRSEKPFALMAFDLQTVRRHCILNPEEETLLLSPQKPIVLLERHPASAVALEVAPQQQTLGVMLAYTPLHLLLLEPAPGFPELLVMTSGNLSEEPICYEDEEAIQRLGAIADAFLLHDRPIHTRVDDSVVRIIEGASYPIRRARGYAPDPLTVAGTLSPILATGTELKNTFCLTRDRYAFLSHHIGDMQNYETLRSFEEGIIHYQKLFRIQPEIIACDLHPDYLASRYAHQRAEQDQLPLIQIQHHHAHLAACLGDNGWDSAEPVIGLTFDGTGLGTDSAIWGGEVLLGNYQGYQRYSHLAYTPQPGGDISARKPARMALSYLWQAGIDWETDLPPVQALCYEERTALRSQLGRQINSPMTSSMGRLFDAISALLGICQVNTYEGQAAIEMEALADPAEMGFYPLEIQGDQIIMNAMLYQIISDWRAGISIPVLAARFHNSIVQLVVELCLHVRNGNGHSTVALSGGVWQNRLLLTKTLQELKRAKFTVLIHHRVPANDGGIALGQALIANALTKG